MAFTASYKDINGNNVQNVEINYSNVSFNSGISGTRVYNAAAHVQYLDPVLTEQTDPSTGKVIYTVSYFYGFTSSLRNVLYDINTVIRQVQWYGAFYYSYPNMLALKLPYDSAECAKILEARITQTTSNTDKIYKCRATSTTEICELLLNKYTTFHSDPVYVEATKLNYTDGTYNFIRGAASADRARKAAYNSLLKTYGSFYKATERQLSEAFAQSLLNGGGN